VTREDDVDFLVLEALLRVLLDDVLARFGGDVGIDPEGADVERAPDRAPEQRPADDGDRLDLVELDALPALAHRGDSTPWRRRLGGAAQERRSRLCRR
jgi:hypothetical protein